MKDFDLDSFLPYQLIVVATRLSREFSTLYHQKFAISVPEWRVVAHLAKSGTVSVREIHERVDMDKPKVSRAASRLEENGYVRKTQNPKDGRLVALTLTQKGQDMMAELIPVAENFNAKLLDSLGPDADTFKAALEKLG